MIIKSMSRKHPSFDQLIDYIESERKLKSKQFSVFHNIYNRNSDQIKNEFSENASKLKFRKNGVYLYHEVVSITRAKHIDEDQQKATLQKIVMEYLQMRARNNLAYAVLHEDKKDNLHFHIVISANEAEDTTRKRLSKADFAEIQTRLEKWVLEHHPELEQKAVFYPNQTDQEREERKRKAHISNKGAELKRRAGKTSTRDQIKDTLTGIFETARDGRHFTELLDEENLKIYQRGKQHGVIDQDGTKYRFSTLGLAEEWEALDRRMTENLQWTKHTKTAEQQFEAMQKESDGMSMTNAELNVAFTRERVERVWSFPHDVTKNTEQTQSKQEQEKALDSFFTENLDQKQEEAMKQPTEKEDIATEAKATATGTSPFAVAKEFILHPTDNPIQREQEEEVQRRLEEARAMREAKANNQASTGQRNSNKNQSS
jgi:hypothetical protein